MRSAGPTWDCRMVRADIGWLQKTAETLAGISDPCESGILRQSYSPAFRQAVQYMGSLMEETGMAVREDEAGNLLGTLPGSEEGLPELMSGSHLDTVRCAGAFDGAAGVICALEAARMVQRSGVPLRHPYTVFGTVGEEGTRFGQVLLGSRFMAGVMEEEQLDTVKDLESGESLRSVMRAYGLTGDPMKASLHEKKIRAFVELHGEQGPVLEQSGADIGVVQAIAGIIWLEVSICGQAGHSGTVPMDARRDAGIAAYQMILRLNDYVTERYGKTATMTNGQLTLKPGSSNCIPGEAVFTLDYRSGDGDILQDLLEKTREEAENIKKEGYEVSVRLFSRKEPVVMDRRIQSMIRESCRELGCRFQDINSGAGHDSMVFAPVWPAAMIFVPNKDGISHHPAEFISWEHMKKGTEVLYQTLRRLDNPD